MEFLTILGLSAFLSTLRDGLLELAVATGRAVMATATLAEGEGKSPDTCA